MRPVAPRDLQPAFPGTALPDAARDVTARHRSGSAGARSIRLAAQTVDHYPLVSDGLRPHGGWDVNAMNTKRSNRSVRLGRVQTPARAAATRRGVRLHG